ncbi:hypothetical protein DFA_04045 [Cavenderia fasciculata]|uniref:F-box domain-containing protein n=1 Tax=Cavenderia fasciculata TaxID=261658 RepID=F4Q150_CACFS|nr:uncharacterized protein DFA_04045 [Cavenderia fasciculata]EGG18551.1 hypothetical protein DFA_04045 [Cavenderia fasciculata]|eukprot:XP_004366455.1 hypothetical protein DFA_04045 [Cavenderia fasciculata]
MNNNSNSSNDDDRCYIEYRKIPTILLLQIIGYLDNIDLICLLLTCRSYYYDLKDQYSSSITFKGLDRIQQLQQRYSGIKSLFIHSKGPYQLNGFTSLYRNAISDQLMVGRDFGTVESINRVGSVRQIIPTDTTSTITTMMIGTMVGITAFDQVISLPPTITRLYIRNVIQPLVTAYLGLPNLKELYLAGYHPPDIITIPDSVKYLRIRYQDTFKELVVHQGNLETLVLICTDGHLDKIQGLSSSCIKTMNLSCKTYGLTSTTTPSVLPCTLTSLNIKVGEPLPDTFVFPPMLVSLTYAPAWNATTYPLNIQNLVNLERLVLTVPDRFNRTGFEITFPPINHSQLNYIDVRNTTTKLPLKYLNTSCLESLLVQHISQIQYDNDNDETTTTTKLNILPNLKRFKGQADYYHQIATLSNNLQILSIHYKCHMEFPKGSFPQLKRLCLNGILTSFKFKTPRCQHDLHKEFPPNLTSIDYIKLSAYSDNDILYIPSSLESLAIKAYQKNGINDLYTLPQIQIINNQNNNQNNNSLDNNNQYYLPPSLKRLIVNLGTSDVTSFKLSEIINRSNVESLKLFGNAHSDQKYELELSIKRLGDDKYLERNGPNNVTIFQGLYDGGSSHSRK